MPKLLRWGKSIANFTIAITGISKLKTEPSAK